ncbi:MAG: hypothetical protein HC935_02100 [Pseudanabaena sp. SU_2_4]|nr:hypothetical protein [Pseudanabaena sp. SU_2_4]
MSDAPIQHITINQLKKISTTAGEVTAIALEAIAEKLRCSRSLHIP